MRDGCGCGVRLGDRRSTASTYDTIVIPTYDMVGRRNTES
jgi:hypothetical protein